MNVIKRTIGTVAVAAVATVGYGDDAGAGTAEEIVGAGAIMRCALNLSDVWDKRNVNDEPILWSSLGWEDAAEAGSGKTVTLQLIPRQEGGTQTLESGLTGHRQTYVWTPGEVTKQVYDIKHIVVGGSPLEELNAHFSFEHYDHVAPSEQDVRAAIRSDDGTGWDFGIVNDEENWWGLAGGPGEGIVAPQGESVFAFAVDGRGTFFFDYILTGGAWTVSVDGVSVESLAEAADWTTFGLSLEGMRVHAIVFSTDLPTGGDSAWLRNVRWVDDDWCSRAGLGSGAAVDLRTNDVLIVRRANELMPFAWSSTNFTGNALVKSTGFIAINPQSVASVRVVQVTGAGDDVSQWATEVAGTEKTLVAEKQGEGTVKWKHVKPGVWKAELVITPPAGEAYRETRILDLRNYSGPGLVLFVM